jgi:hypothetical protein
MGNVLTCLQGSQASRGRRPARRHWWVLAAVCGNDLEHRFDIAAVVACSAIVTGALLAAGLKTGRG